MQILANEAHCRSIFKTKFGQQLKLKKVFLQKFCSSNTCITFGVLKNELILVLRHSVKWQKTINCVIFRKMTFGKITRNRMIH
jgi:hypothetical protein